MDFTGNQASVLQSGAPAVKPLEFQESLKSQIAVFGRNVLNTEFLEFIFDYFLQGKYHIFLTHDFKQQIFISSRPTVDPSYTQLVLFS